MRPLTHGSVLIVGAKASNFDAQVRENPRITWWDSQDERWSGKSIPENIQAVFFTKWVGHTDFGNIMKDVRKRRITVFQPQGTGMIAKQVKELLTVNPVDSVSTNHTPASTITHYTVTLPETTMPRIYRNKLAPLAPFVDVNKSDAENGVALFAKAQELGIPTTPKSMVVFASREKRKIRGHIGRGPSVKTRVLPKYATLDVTVEIFDNLLKELKDMREFLVQTVAENRSLRTRIQKFKQYLDED